jgi:hypothetical protein
MSIGTQIKAHVDAVRNALGSECNLNGTSIGKCSIHDISNEATKDLLGTDYQDEISTRWAMIETPSEKVPKEQDKITLVVTGQDYVVTRVSPAVVAGVVCAYRCLCEAI